MATIGEIIDAKQKDLTCVGGKIQKIPIYLRIYKKNFFDLTLVDLPGMTYQDGMGPIIKNLYIDYITN